MNQLIKIFLITVIGIASCKSIKPVKPEEVYAPEKRVYDKEVSVINIPIEIAVADIEKQINAYVKGVIYEDNSYEDNDGDDAANLQGKEQIIHAVKALHCGVNWRYIVEILASHA